MKMLALIAAGCLAATAVVPAAADAQVRVRVVTTNHNHHNNWHGHDRWRNDCRTTWHHGHRTRVCHRVRW